jgi:hypothetical protein
MHFNSCAAEVSNDCKGIECLDFKLFLLSGVRVLVDPWLVGELVFFDQDWLYKGKKRVLNAPGKVDIDAIAAETDVVVITQVPGILHCAVNYF